MKNVLLLIENFLFIEGGSGCWFWELYLRFFKNKVSIVMYDFEGGGEFDKFYEFYVICILLVNFEWGVKNILGLCFYFVNVRKLLKLVK